MNSVKVIRVGNSLAVTVPRELAVRLNLREGDRMTPKVEEEGIVYASSKSTSEEDRELSKFLKDFKKQYGPAMKKLAKL